MSKLSITVPDGMPTDEVADYIRTVADQVEGYFTSGHVKPEQHWTTEEGRLS